MKNALRPSCLSRPSLDFIFSSISRWATGSWHSTRPIWISFSFSFFLVWNIFIHLGWDNFKEKKERDWQVSDWRNRLPVAKGAAGIPATRLLIAGLLNLNGLDDVVVVDKLVRDVGRAVVNRRGKKVVGVGGGGGGSVLVGLGGKVTLNATIGSDESRDDCGVDIVVVVVVSASDFSWLGWTECVTFFCSISGRRFSSLLPVVVFFNGRGRRKYQFSFI